MNLFSELIIKKWIISEFDICIKYQVGHDIHVNIISKLNNRHYSGLITLDHLNMNIELFYHLMCNCFNYYYININGQDDIIDLNFVVTSCSIKLFFSRAFDYHNLFFQSIELFEINYKIPGGPYFKNISLLDQMEMNNIINLKK